MIRRLSITAAMSMLIGQRVVQASHNAQSQIARDESTSSAIPSCTSRITWLESRSISGPTGQPVEHLWHWRQTLTSVPLRLWTSWRKVAADALNAVCHAFVLSFPCSFM